MNGNNTSRGVSMTLWGMLESMAAASPHANALIFSSERCTVRELRAQAQALATGLHGLGVVRGDCVVIGLNSVPLCAHGRLRLHARKRQFCV